MEEKLKKKKQGFFFHLAIPSGTQERCSAKNQTQGFMHARHMFYCYFSGYQLGIIVYLGTKHGTA